MNGDEIARRREAALVAEKAGRASDALAHFDAALALAPDDARLLNSAGGSALRLNELARAQRLYEQAHEKAPEALEYAVNLAIVLERRDRARAAVQLLRRFEGKGRADPRYWSVRGASERADGDLAAASASYTHCLALDSRHAKALHGRARVALERGEKDAQEHYARALGAVPGDAGLWLGRAMALEAAGKVDEARQIAGSLCAQMPGWLDAHRYLAELRLNTEADALVTGAFADHFAAAVTKLPRSADVALAWASALAGADRFEQAFAVGREALARMPAEPRLQVATASYASASGALAEAEGLFAGMRDLDVDAQVEYARHKLRTRDPQAAQDLLAAALEEAPGHVSAWGLRSLAWRLLEDPREEWLHGQEGLVRQLPLDIAERDWAEITALLHHLHDESFVPVGQSVRGGSQTRGSLFARAEAPLRMLHGAIMEVIERYRGALPPLDAGHPLLARREERLAITGSWSVRLGPGGRHTVHIHPRGVLSSALYVDLPDLEGDAPDAGSLEVGGAPPEMGLELPARMLVPARARHLTLFPSTLFHGTRPFARGRRMTVAFDVTARLD